MNVVELFGCSGGMAEGARRAGVEISLAVDWSADACASYEANLGHRPVQMDAADLLRMLRSGWTISPIDLLIADPPCTPWSRAGKRMGQEDPRDMLATTVEIIRATQPKTWLVANVPGLDDEPNLPVVQRTIGSLRGYCVDFARLDAADYGVPQHRVRPFWFGHQLGTPCVQWPSRTHGETDARAVPLPCVESLLPYVTCRQALDHLPPSEIGHPIRLRWRTCSSAQHGSVLDKPALVVGTSNLSDGNVLVSGPTPRERHPRSHIDEPGRTITTSTSNGAATLFDGPNHRPSRADMPARTLTQNSHSDGAYDRPSPVVMADDRLPPPGHHYGSNLSGPSAIKLSEKAAAILQGFPESWKFVGKTKRSRWQQIGMAMPPPLAEAVFRAIVARDRARRTAA